PGEAEREDPRDEDEPDTERDAEEPPPPPPPGPGPEARGMPLDCLDRRRVHVATSASSRRAVRSGFIGVRRRPGHSANRPPSDIRPPPTHSHITPGLRKTRNVASRPRSSRPTSEE